MIYKRTHPIQILEGIKRLGIVFLLVFLRGFLTALNGGFSAWLSSVWVDVGVVFVILTITTVHWWNKIYCFDGQTIAVKGGVLLFTDKKVPLAKISSVTCEQPLLYRVFGATRVRIDTVAGTKHRVDITLVLPDEIAREIANSIFSGERKILTTKFSYVMLLSAFVSDSFAGAGLLAVSIARLGAVAGEEIEQRIVDTIDSLLHLIPSGLPPIAKTIAVAILFGWMLGFLINLIRHYDFTIIRDKTTLTIKGGALTRRASRLKTDDINFINIKQGIFTKLFKIDVVFVHASGVGKKKGDIKAIPRAMQETLLPEYKPSQNSLRPDKRAFLGFIADPLWVLLPLILLTALIIIFTKASTKLVLSLATFVSIPFIWWLLVRIVDLFTSGIAFEKDTLTLRYSSFLNFNTTIIKREKIVTLKLRQSLFQRLGNRCDVLVYTKGETAFRHRVRNLDIKEARKLLRI